MCLEIKRLFNTKEEALKHKPLIAKRNIKVMKFFDGKSFKHDEEAFKSPYKYTIYQRNKLYVINHFGLDVQQSSDSNFKKYQIEIYRGLHSYELSDFKDPIGAFIALCIIPKGAKYYKGKNGNIVSNLLYVTDKYHKAVGSLFTPAADQVQEDFRKPWKGKIPKEKYVTLPSGVRKAKSK